MTFPKASLGLALFTLGTTTAKDCDSPGTLTCRPTTVPPTLDGDLSEWADVEGINTQITQALGLQVPYQPGNVDIKCLYDETHIYFSLKVPGEFRFDPTDNKKCAAIATMMKIGDQATFKDMGGCPEAMAGCSAGAVPNSCEPYRVDIGAHWELKDTQQGQAYPINVADGSGNDPVANKDDEYAVSASCRFDDDGTGAGNEWAGAWAHSDSASLSTEDVTGEYPYETGKYSFELSRLLTTGSPQTDRQLAAGGTYSFGLAYWDPYENESMGWTGFGHFVTGCSSQWIDLVLAEGTTTAATAPTMNSGSSATATAATSTSEDILPVPTTAAATTAKDCDSPGTLTCRPTTVPPTLDGDPSEWANVTGINTQITQALGEVQYQPGNVEVKCVYDETNIYFSLEVPGEFRFDPTDNKKCAAIATMMKIGDQATFKGMGGCPEAMAGCSAGAVPNSCDPYRVDIGAHWELKDTQQGQAYPINVADISGDDPVANKDDEYAVSPYCRFDDDGPGAGNEWAGAWAHSYSAVATTEGATGKYSFELSRLLTTSSPQTDRQLAAGGTYSFGLAYWDPNENKRTGWTAPGHFVTGCAFQWIDLVLEEDATSLATAPTMISGSSATATAATSSSGDILPVPTPAAEPTTQAPVTPEPTTPAPVTPEPTTPAPVTPGPTTPAPVTLEPTATPTMLAEGTPATAATTENECIYPGALTCHPTTVPPTLDGDLSEWADVTGINTQITQALGQVPYQPGNVEIKCLFDKTNIYFAVEVPGQFRFNSTDNKKCAAIATMMKIGDQATFVNMGGCPEAMAGCSAGAIPNSCDPYRVDIGAHWELKDTQQGQAYPINVADGSGDDPVANKDDEYAVSSSCRFDDDGPGAGNEWAGAWGHSNSGLWSIEEATGQYPFVTGKDPFDTGKYWFELSRALTTGSPQTDRQLAAGGTYSFGLAYWDPNENGLTGWSAHGHFVTGCSREWIDLVLSDGTNTTETAPTIPSDVTTVPNSGDILAVPSKATTLGMTLLALLVYVL